MEGLQLIAWPHKFNIEQPSIVLNPCFILSSSVSESSYCSPAPLRPSQSGNTGANSSFSISDFASQTACFALGINVGSFCPLGLYHHVPFLQGAVDLVPCILLLYSFVHPFIPPPVFWFPLVVLGETTNFGGNKRPFGFDQADSTW